MYLLSILLNEEENVINEYVGWLYKKTGLNFSPVAHKNFNILNNYIYWAYLGFNIGSEEGKHRPVLVTRTSLKSPICAIIPLTTQRLNDGFWYHVDLEKTNSTALVEQMRVIDKRRIE